MLVNDFLTTDERLVLENVGTIDVAIKSRDGDEIETFKIPVGSWLLGVDQLIKSEED
jgi:hypothetical protein